MSERAQCDGMYQRAELKAPGRKAAIRQELIKRLGTLGRVEYIERFVMDPPDGPFRDGTMPDFDGDLFAVIRVIGQVTPTIANMGGPRPQ